MIPVRYLFVAFAVYLIGMGAIVAWSNHNVSNLGERNCRQIEKLKANVREQSKFDLKEAKKTLRQLGVDPESVNGKELIRTSGRNATITRARFAPVECP